MRVIDSPLTVLPLL